MTLQTSVSDVQHNTFSNFSKDMYSFIFIFKQYYRIKCYQGAINTLGRTCLQKFDKNKQL